MQDTAGKTFKMPDKLPTIPEVCIESLAETECLEEQPGERSSEPEDAICMPYEDCSLNWQMARYDMECKLDCGESGNEFIV